MGPGAISTLEEFGPRSRPKLMADDWSGCGGWHDRRDDPDLDAATLRLVVEQVRQSKGSRFALIRAGGDDDDLGDAA